MLDDGRITDGQGRTVNFKNTIIILTSNVGAAAIVDAGGDETKRDEVRPRATHPAHLAARSARSARSAQRVQRTAHTAAAPRVPQVRLRVLDQLRAQYRPEFLNRLDELVLFDPLTKPQLRQIAALTLTSLTERLEAKQIGLHVSDSALGVLTDLGYSPEYGARPLKRTVQKELETPIARGLIGGDFLEGDTLEVDTDLDATSLKITVVAREEGSGPPPTPGPWPAVELKAGSRVIG